MTEAEFVEACMAATKPLDEQMPCPKCGHLLRDSELYAACCDYCAPAEEIEE